MNELESVIEELRLEERSLLFSKVQLETEDYLVISGYEVGEITQEDIWELNWYKSFVKDMDDIGITADVTTLQLGKGEPEWATEEELDSIVEYRRELEEVYNIQEIETKQYGLYHTKEVAWEEGEEQEDLPYEKVKDKIYAEIINQERKEEMPGRVYKDIEGMDLTTAFWIEGENGQSEMVTEKMVRDWNVLTEKLYKTAIRNTQRDYEPVIKNSKDLIDGISNEKIELTESLKMKEHEPYVLTIEGAYKGAVAVLYPELLQQLSEKMQGSLFIVPSSVHEVFLLKDNGYYRAKELQTIVIEGNSGKYIREDEILSNNVYRYDKEGQCLEMATTKEQANEMFGWGERLAKIIGIEDEEWERE